MALRDVALLFLTAFHPMVYGHGAAWIDLGTGRIWCRECLIRRGRP